MADSRLVWNQLTAPDLSAASQAMARAGAAFSDGMGTGSSILAKYAEGQQAKADDAILSEIAGLKDEAAFDEFVSGGGLAGRNISQGMRDHILKMRSNFVNDEGVRARTDGTRASTENTRATMGINLAREARSAAEWQDGMARRDAERAAAGDIEAARAFSAQYGDTIGGITQKGSALDNYLAHTVKSESGWDPNAENPLSSATGLGQFTTGTWNQMMKNHPELNLTPDGRTNPEQSMKALRAFTKDNMSLLGAVGIPITEGNLYAAHFLGAGGARSVLTANDDQYLENLLPKNVIQANPFLRGMSVGEFRSWSAKKGGQGLGSADVTINTPVQNARQGLLDTGLFTAADVDRMLAGATQAGKSRSDELLAADKAAQEAAQKEAEAQAAMSALLDPNNLSGGDMARGILSDPNMSAQERMRVLDTASGLAEANPGVLSPDPTKDPNSALALSPDGQPDTRVGDIAAGIKQDLNAALAARPQTQLVDDIDKFSQEDPAQALESVLGLGSDRESDTWFRDYDQNDLRNLTRDYAKEFGVDEPTAAAAMRQAFERDPWGRNTIENRFDKDRVGSIIKESLSQDQISGAREDRRRASQLQSRADSIVQQINLLQTQARKGGDRSAIAQEIANLTVELTTIRSEAAQLFGTPSRN